MSIKLAASKFQAYDLSDREVLEGSIFTELQLAVLHNHMVTETELRLSLAFDPKEPERFMQAEAEYKGKVELIQHLIESSNLATETLVGSINETTEV